MTGHAPISGSLDRADVLGRDVAFPGDPMGNRCHRDADFVGKGLVGLIANKANGASNRRVRGGHAPTVLKVLPKRNTLGVGGTDQFTNTIGSMNEQGSGPVPTPFSRALGKAIRTANRSHEDIAEAMGVSAGLVSAWVTGRKPVPATRAMPLAAYLDCKPEDISSAFATIAAQDNVRALPGARLNPDLEKNRAENDVDALRLIVSALVSVAVVHRPAEARELARVLRRSAPKRFLDQGYLGLQLAALERAVGQPKEAAPAASRPRAKR